MDVHIILFGSLAEVAGNTHIRLSACRDTDDLKDKWLKRFPQSKELSFVIAVNKEIVKKNSLLKKGQEIAFLPPFAGG